MRSPNDYAARARKIHRDVLSAEIFHAKKMNIDGIKGGYEDGANHMAWKCI